MCLLILTGGESSSRLAAVSAGYELVSDQQGALFLKYPRLWGPALVNLIKLYKQAKVDLFHLIWEISLPLCTVFTVIYAQYGLCNSCPQDF